MKRVSAQLSAVIFSIGLGFGLPPAAQAESAIHVSDPSLCIDGMETVPDSDDLEPILAAADGSCAAPQGTISI
ncbi:MAG TPA: hypothetical protein VN175_01740 [Rhizomicrobium sp.]|nr:hypothetical protein [Rhizomicrobium sp.]